MLREQSLRPCWQSRSAEVCNSMRAEVVRMKRKERKDARASHGDKTLNPGETRRQPRVPRQQTAGFHL
jgi:hypothetical protein